MAKRKTPEPKGHTVHVAARGSYIGANGRVRYDVPAGPLSADAVDEETLARLIARGVIVADPVESVPAREPAPAESEEDPQ